MSPLTILVIHGPNLDRLGQREPQIYGVETLHEIDASLHALGSELGVTTLAIQSNQEGELVERIHAARDEGSDGILINPAGLGHTSVVLRDALLATELPFVELHCSNPAAREEFRRRSLLADRALGTVAGFGGESYRLALRGLVASLRSTT